MATKTISLSEDAYERLKNMKRENESFSDVVRRLCTPIKLRDFYGVLSPESAASLENTIEEARRTHREERERRMERMKRELQS